MTSPTITLLKILADNDVEFVVVGGFAGVFHGCTYVTQDIDICCNFTVDNILRLQKALSDLHPVHRMTPTHIKLELTAESAAQFKNLYLDTDIGQLDCLGYIYGIGDYSDVLKASELLNMQGVKLRVLKIGSLIKAKEAMNRPRDREAILQLTAIMKLRDNGKKE